MGKLNVRLFGPLESTVDGVPVSGFDSDKVRALLAYLIVEADRPHRREKLAGLLWPDFSERSARTNLRRALYNLRQVIKDQDSDPRYLHISRQSIQFNMDSDAWIDVAQFISLVQGSGGQTPDIDALGEAIDLVRGPFLEGFSLPDSPPFEEWQRLTGESLQQQHLSCLYRLTRHYEGQGDIERALTLAQQQIALDPFREEAHQQIMRLLFHKGGRNEALAHYEMLRKALAEELNVTPTTETVALYEQIQSGELRPTLRERPQAVRGYQLRERLGSGHFGAVYRAHQQVIGRDVAIKIILPHFADNPDFIRRFTLEAQIVARLEHPYIVPLYDYWREPGKAFLVMRWLRGGSLEQALKRGPWKLAPAGELVQQIAGALHFAHRQGIIHRDIKPGNILLDDAGHAYLSDFGIASLVPTWSGFTPDFSPESDFSSGSLGYQSPEVIRDEPAGKHADIYSFGVVLYELLTAQHPFPGLQGQALLDKHLHAPFPSVRAMRPELPDTIDAIIARATAKDPADRFPDALTLARSFLDVADNINGSAIDLSPGAAIQNPYKGLRPFEEVDAANFFGRGVLVERLLDWFEANRFLAVIGPSGSGKSSAIKAGLIPALRQGRLPGAQNWFIVEMTPGGHPMEELETALLRVAVNPPASLLAQLQADERGLLRAVRRTLPDEESELFLFVDQFEELFTLVEDEDVRAHFLNSLLNAVRDPKSPLRLVLTLRADFYDRPLQYPDFGDLIRRYTEVVLPLSADEVGRAVTKPAGRMGVTFVPGLVAEIAADVSGQPGALPLLQYALTELFEQRKGAQLDLDTYRAMGGVTGALVHRAETIMTELDETGRKTVRQLFLQLVAMSNEGDVIRRRVLRPDLEALTEAHQEHLSRVIDTFGAARLLTFDHDPVTRAPTVELAHEALLREWSRLRQWLAESREDLSQQRRLQALSDEWMAHDQDPGLLLRETRLDQFAAWAQQTDMVLSGDEQTFLHASLAARQERRAAAEARRQRELETVQILAETERQRAQEQTAAAGRLRRRAFFLVGALVLAVILAGVAVAFSRQATRNAALAATREGEAFTEANQRATAEAVADAQRQLALASAAEAQTVAIVAGSQAALAKNDTDTALALAWQAVNINPDSAATQSQLSEAAYAPGTRRIFTGNETAVNRVEISPDNQSVIAGVEDGSVILWAIDDGEILWQHQVHTEEVNDVGFSPDGQIVSATFNDRLFFWNTATGKLINQIDAVALDQKIAFSPAGDQFATIGKEVEGRLVIWNLETQEVVSEFSRGSEIEDLVFSADGSTILLASVDGTLTLVDTQTGEIIYQVHEDLGANAGVLRFVALHPDGTKVAAAFSNFGVLVREFATGDLLQALQSTGGALALAYHPQDGTLFIVDEGILYNIDSQSGEILSSNTSQNSAIFGLTVSSDGKNAVTTSLNGTVRLWDLQGGQVVRRYIGPTANLYEIALSPDGQTVLVGSTDGTATLFEVATGAEIWRFVDDQPIGAVSFSPDGRTALLGAGYRLAQKIESGHILLIDVQTGTEIRRFEGQPYAVIDVEFSPDGNLAVSSGNGALAILWDVETGAEIRRFEDFWVDSFWPNQSFWNVDFTPDGQQIFAHHASGPIIGWDVASGAETRQLLGHDGGGAGIVFGSNGEILISGSVDSQVILWEMDTGRILRRLSDHAGGVGEVRLSPDETLLLGGGADGTNSLWVVDTGKVIRRYGGGQVFSPFFTPDGRQAVVGYHNGTVELWRIDTTLAELRTWTQNNRYIAEVTCEQRELYRIEPLCEVE